MKNFRALHANLSFQKLHTTCTATDSRGEPQSSIISDAQEEGGLGGRTGGSTDVDDADEIAEAELGFVTAAAARCSHSSSAL